MVAPSIETRIRAHGKRPARRWARRQAADIPLSSIRTVTVGVGLKPTLLTLPIGLGKRSRARAISRLHRRSGLSPRPENVRRPTLRDRPARNHLPWFCFGGNGFV